mmetsp:Transcript_18212/g.37324  ORF Transcript_18212/g.37324 Transcript_18212/m.37324 type:complete len:292 (-) Transcript_18212:237-1112(-)
MPFEKTWDRLFHQDSLHTFLVFLLLQNPQFQEGPFLAGVVVLFELRHTSVAGRPAGHKVELLQKDLLGVIGLFQGKGVQKVHQHHAVLAAGSGAKGIDELFDRFELEVDEGCGREKYIGLSDRFLGLSKGLRRSVVEITDKGVVVEPYLLSVGHGLRRNVDGGDVAFLSAKSLAGLGDGRAGFLVLPVVTDLVVGHAVEGGHGGVSETGAEIDILELVGGTAALLVKDGSDVVLEHGLVEVVRDVIQGVEDAGLVRDGGIADVDVVEVLFLFVRLDSRVVDVVCGVGHGGK